MRCLPENGGQSQQSDVTAPRTLKQRTKSAKKNVTRQNCPAQSSWMRKNALIRLPSYASARISKCRLNVNFDGNNCRLVASRHTSSCKAAIHSSSLRACILSERNSVRSFSDTTFSTRMATVIQSLNSVRPHSSTVDCCDQGVQGDGYSAMRTGKLSLWLYDTNEWFTFLQPGSIFFISCVCMCSRPV